MSDVVMQTPVNGTVNFIQHVLPGLDSGAYMLRVSETLSTQTAVPTNSYFFAVAGTRFALNPADLFATYPPDQAVGEFDGTLPHVVLTSRTLPWQRYPTLDEPPRFFDNSPHDRDVPTWLAVLLFDADDEADFAPNFSVQPTTGKVSDLFVTQVNGTNIHSQFWEAGNVGAGADLSKFLDYGETGNDAVQYIDVPMGLFWKVAPSADDLKMMAHVRNVNLISKATQNGVPAGRNDLSQVPGTSDFAIVMGNRMPKSKAGMRTFAHLVSLEGLAPFLPGDSATSDNASDVTNPSQAVGDGGSPVVPIGAGDKMRLVTLASWSFTSTGDSSHFTQMVGALAPKTPGVSPDFSFGMPVPAATGTEPAGTVAARKALGQGFTALRHHTRDGGSTVSWYRGPLLPGALDTQVVPDTMASSDAATRYDPASGMFDLSYAGAWQLGRLLGIQDKRFSTLLVNWRRQNLSDAVTRMESLVVHQSMDDIQNQLRDDTLIYPLLQAFAPPVAKALPQSTMLKLRVTAGTHLNAARSLRGELNRSILTNTSLLAPVITWGLQVPLEIYKWLAGIKLLQGVPFRYLVADEAMLPPESLRFFHVDMNWVDSLIDGALSIGRNGAPTSPEATHDDAVYDVLDDSSDSRALQSRAIALGLIDDSDLQTDGEDIVADDPPVTQAIALTGPQDDAPALETVTGFLLRSEVVKGWPGLEVNGYAPDGALLDIVRFERLSPTVLLCLFEKDGKPLYQLDIHEPAEGLHSGLSAAGTAVNIRYNYADTAKPPAFGAGTQVKGVNQAVPFRGTDQRVIRMFRLSRDLLDPKYQAYIQPPYSGFDHLPSSQFAMQMLRGVGLVSFILDGSATS